MARILDANLAFSGGEPKFSTELTKIELMKALNWYAQNKTSKDAEKWAQDYFKKKLRVDAGDTLKNVPDTFGYLCRIVLNGGSLSVSNLTWFESQIKEITESANKPKKKVVVKDDNAQPVVTIQDRIREKSQECIGELEGQLDDYITSGFKSDANPYAIMHTLNIKSVHVNRIVEFAKRRRGEFDEILNTDDKELKEAYSNFTKVQLKKVVSWCDQIILDTQKILGSAQQNRKPRKRKQKSAEELVVKLKVLDKYDELKLVGVPTKEIIGALQIWVYNVKQRKLGCYHAEDAGGFSVKGTTITNFSESKSIQKRLRKPEVTLPELMKGGKVALRTLLDSVKAVEAPLTGRLNGDTILVRIIK
jgi:hypothetical protein